MSEPTGRRPNSTPAPDPTVRSLRIVPGIHVQDRVTAAVGKVMQCRRVGPSIHFEAANGHGWDRDYSWREAGQRLKGRPDLDAATAPEHEAHGHCRSCGNAAHRYPFGWDHVNTGMYACAKLDPEVTCCEEHGAGQQTPSLGERLGFEPVAGRTYGYNGQEHR